MAFAAWLALSAAVAAQEAGGQAEFDRALQQARAEKKALFIDFSHPW